MEHLVFAKSSTKSPKRASNDSQQLSKSLSIVLVWFSVRIPKPACQYHLALFSPHGSGSSDVNSEYIHHMA
jgi:hypothetical protein